MFKTLMRQGSFEEIKNKVLMEFKGGQDDI